MVEPLRKTWPQWRRYDLEIPELPKGRFLSELLEAVYHASFTLDEGRRTKFGVVVCSPGNSDQSTVFAQPREMSVQELRRLAPVAKDGNALVGIAWPDLLNPPLIWGLCSSALTQLKITTSAPGVLEVGRDGHIFLTLREGKIFPEELESGIFEPISDFLSDVNSELWQDLYYEGGWSPEIVVYPGYLLEIVSRISRSGHGGAILLVPDDASPSDLMPTLVRTKYICDDNQLGTAIKTVMQRFSKNPDKYATEQADRELKCLINRTADLANIDGAVILTDRFRVLGFGAEILVHSELGKITTKSNDSRVKAESFGTRHRSAFRFCQAYPKGMAIICSQDGGARVVRAPSDGGLELFE